MLHRLAFLIVFLAAAHTLAQDVPDARVQIIQTANGSRVIILGDNSISTASAGYTLPYPAPPDTTAHARVISAPQQLDQLIRIHPDYIFNSGVLCSQITVYRDDGTGYADWSEHTFCRDGHLHIGGTADGATFYLFVGPTPPRPRFGALNFQARA